MGKDLRRRVQMHVCTSKRTIHHQGMTATSTKTRWAAVTFCCALSFHRAGTCEICAALPPGTGKPYP